MSQTHAELREQLAALEQAYNSGVRSTVVDGETITYESGDEMRRRISSLKRQLGMTRRPTASSIDLSGACE